MSAVIACTHHDRRARRTFRKARQLAQRRSSPTTPSSFQGPNTKTMIRIEEILALETADEPKSK
jgi:hypothetical protein